MKFSFWTGPHVQRRTVFAVAILIAGLAPSACSVAKRATPVSQSPGPASEDLWVVARAAKEPTATNPTAAVIELRTREPGAVSDSPLPLLHTDVRASINGYVASVDMTRQFLNTNSRPADLVYVFSLPPNAAVTDFVMTIGARRIRGIVRDRVEAEEIYRQAKQKGLTAALLQAEPSGVFRQSVSNIEPGRDVNVNMTYYQVLQYAGGWYEFAFPLPAPRPGGVGNSLRVEMAADGTPIEEAVSATHRIIREKVEPGRLVVTLDPMDQTVQRDFVLRYRVAGGRVRSLSPAIQKMVETNGLSALAAFLAVDAQTSRDERPATRPIQGER